MSGQTLRNVTVDAVVFGYSPEQNLRVLLVKRKYDPHINQWALPGGFVQLEESLEEAVHRELQEETGISVGYLEQLYTFGDPDRDSRRRIISVAYLALVKPDAFELVASTDAADARWFDIRELPELAFDHQNILELAFKRLRNKVFYEPIGFELLDDKFPFVHLYHLYLTMLAGDGPLQADEFEAQLERRNFKRLMLKRGLIVELNERRQQKGSGRPARLYRFDPEKYEDMKKEGFSFEL
ncbi:MAG: NUDIX domain-containing protein [Bacteroidota bacterium]